MRIAVIGGGPGGLYFAYLWKKRHPDAADRSVRAEPRRRHLGLWRGVLRAGAGIPARRRSRHRRRHHAADGELEEHHAQSARRKRRDRRRRLLLDRPARSADDPAAARIRASASRRATTRSIQSADQLTGYDLIVAADGLNSLVRRTFEGDFGASVSHSSNKFAWYGTIKALRDAVADLRRNRPRLVQRASLSLRAST